MTYAIALQEQGIRFAPSSEAEEVVQNVQTILGVLQGEVPLNRDFGLPRGFIDRPGPVAEAQLASYIIAAIRRYEPRAKVEQVTFERDDKNGRLLPKVVISLAGDG